MKIIILFESFFGNTEAVAREMGNINLTDDDELEIRNVTGVSWDKIPDVDILIVGSPTRGFQPCENTRKFLRSIPPEGLKGIKVAAFDTRIPSSEIDSRALRFIVKAGGYAAKRIARAMKKKGGDQIAPSEGFNVTGEKGPLADGEKERAAKWVQAIIDRRV